MTGLFTKETFARLTRIERAELIRLQMSPLGTKYGGGGRLPDDSSECGACGDPILGTGWCARCSDRFQHLTDKALGHQKRSP